MNKKLAIWPVALCFCASSLASSSRGTFHDYTAETSRLVSYYKGIGIKVHKDVVETTLKSVDGYLPQYFPNQDFSRQDFIALAMLESNFHQYSTGSSGEKGIFQIMQLHIPRHIKHPFNIRTNTCLAMSVLREKHRRYGDYKKAIIAYNGVIIKHRTKRWSERYWVAFQVRKTVLGDLEIK